CPVQRQERQVRRHLRRRHGSLRHRLRLALHQPRRVRPHQLPEPLHQPAGPYRPLRRALREVGRRRPSVPVRQRRLSLICRFPAARDDLPRRCSFPKGETAMISYSFHWNQAFKALPQMLDGALVTLQIAILSMVVGLAVALALTLFRLSGNRALSGFATGWVEIARNTPALFQIYMAHFGLGNFGIHLSPYTALLVGIA